LLNKTEVKHVFQSQLTVIRKINSSVVTEQDRHQSVSTQNSADRRLWTDVSVVRTSLMLTVQLPHSQMTDARRPHQPCCRRSHALVQPATKDHSGLQL